MRFFLVELPETSYYSFYWLLVLDCIGLEVVVVVVVAVAVVMWMDGWIDRTRVREGEGEPQTN